MSNQNRKSPPNANKIANYWNENLLERHEDGTFYVPNLDIGEPACQACNVYHSSKLTETDWEKHCLEKAHIIPWASGGSDEPSNFLMLCRHCHFDLDNEININDMKDFVKISKWLENRVTQRRAKILKVVSDHVKEKGYNEDRFAKAFTLASATATLGKEKRLEIYIKKTCESADAVYMTIANYDDMGVLDFLMKIKENYQVTS